MITAGQDLAPSRCGNGWRARDSIKRGFFENLAAKNLDSFAVAGPLQVVSQHGQIHFRRGNLIPIALANALGASGEEILIAILGFKVVTSNQRSFLREN
jgi:hypothetical protein